MVSDFMHANTTVEQAARVSLKNIFVQNRWQLLGTWLLVIIEAGLMLMFPLLMGMAIDDLLNQTYRGLYLLAAVGCLTIVAGGSRRFYDTRLYSNIYCNASERIVRQERAKETDVSVLSARTNMARELVEFLENSFPEIVNCVIGVLGTLLMIWLLQATVFVHCLWATAVIILIYTLTTDRTLVLNKRLNDESEQSVNVLSAEPLPAVATHFRRLMRWNIRLSDLETVTFSLSWLVMVALLLFAIVTTVQSGLTTHGQVLAVLMYVFGYIESVIALPLFYQQYVRLQEICSRL